MTTGLDVFDHTVQETNLWLKDLVDYLKTDDRREAHRALRATLHALRDRIGPENAVKFGAQLPMILRGVYYEGWRMDATPTKERSKQEFLDRVASDASASLGDDPENAVRAVFDVLEDKIDSGEVDKLIKLFPEEMRDLWTQPAHAD